MKHLLQKFSETKYSDKTSNIWYYKHQLAELTPDKSYRLKIRDDYGKETKNLDLNLDSIDVIIEFLEALKQELKG